MVTPTRTSPGVEEHTRDDEIESCSRSLESIQPGEPFINDRYSVDTTRAEVTPATMPGDMEIRVSSTRNVRHTYCSYRKPIEMDLEMFESTGKALIKESRTPLADGRGGAKVRDRHAFFFFSNTEHDL